MNDEFLDYYFRELKFIREMGAEFASAHPQEAGQLLLDAQRCEDPHVERLLEGFAFLTARIRKKIDDEYPEITDALLSVLYPHYQRPIPSVTMVQFMAGSDPTRLVAGHEIPQGTALASKPIDGVPCRFRTVYPTSLWPVSVTSASLIPDRVVIADKPAGSVSLLKLELKCSSPGEWPSLDRFSSLRFYLDGGDPIPSTLYESLFNHLCGFWLRGKTADGREKTVPLPVGLVQPVGFSDSEALLPYPPTSFPGYRLIQEFFAFPDKFLFVEVHGLDQIARAGFVGPVELLFFLDQPPRTEVVIRADSFLLGCTPAVNLFQKLSEPIPISHKLTEYAIIPDVNHPLAFEVFSVDRVLSAGSYL
ncbi:MAG TPA: type VI secretion system baseplate subunit TssF, partial [Isosphaeraceae bacterium]|nr:type VI secretion system baseplate subunit TssF [Isosphaeraceae bacterium]